MTTLKIVTTGSHQSTWIIEWRWRFIWYLFTLLLYLYISFYRWSWLYVVLAIAAVLVVGLGAFGAYKYKKLQQLCRNDGSKLINLKGQFEIWIIVLAHLNQSFWDHLWSGIGLSICLQSVNYVFTLLYLQNQEANFIKTLYKASLNKVFLNEGDLSLI